MLALAVALGEELHELPRRELYVDDDDPLGVLERDHVVAALRPVEVGLGARHDLERAAELVDVEVLHGLHLVGEERDVHERVEQHGTSLRGRRVVCCFLVRPLIRSSYRPVIYQFYGEVLKLSEIDG